MGNFPFYGFCFICLLPDIWPDYTYKTKTKDFMELINKYFPDLTESQKEKMTRLEELYQFWNARVNVISRQDIDTLYERHVLHSLGIAKVLQFKSGTSILDVGTGGGFPGIPLAILFPEAQFHLVDSIGKKIRVVQEIATALNLTNVKAEQVRAERLDDTYEFVVSRAVTRLEPFVGWVQKNINRNSFHSLRNGILYLKGGDLTEELSEVKQKTKIYELSDYFTEDFFETKKVVYVPL
ncbi:16S rRNA (guanine(527)-N(7))-methyltransferase RsmG [Dyadobacter psychrotolerans]|uniref:Ribosomal RNA small subunit methyltransferase G n=2 Tax=Dyadobacter psychrotolerans TaxID=2541721 RepID=A0A4R5DI42_9BACT|nr:16S rRNA (guanine(527)-N(7))-methyltransferase RsmG [Dyadobacter psychrotolerans]